LPVNINDLVICDKAKAGDPTVCDPLDLVDGKGTNGYGWQNNTDDDNDTLKDDLFGWDFSVSGPDGQGANLPIPNALCTADPCAKGTSRIPFHGTGVAAIAAGIGNNGVTGPGVAWHARLVLVKAELLSNPVGTDFQSSIDERLVRSSVVSGVRFAEQKANVINLSAGSVISTLDLMGTGICNRGIGLVPDTKFKPGLQLLANEWEKNIGPDQAKAVLVASVNDCAENDDEADIFDYPVGFTIARNDLGISFVHSTMISVTSVENVNYDLSGNPTGVIAIPGAISKSNFAASGAQTVLLGAPGENWRLAKPQTYPPTTITTGVEDCTELGPTGFSGAKFCSGTSFAAPMVTGAAALVFANSSSNGVVNASDVKNRLLNNAVDDTSLINLVAGHRLLDIAAAVGP